MPTTRRYLQSTTNLDAVLGKIVEGAAPTRFTLDHLKGLGFTSSNDRSFIPMLKDLGFLTEDGVPTARYHEYRDASRSKAVLGQALRDAYPDVFLVKENPSAGDRAAVRGKLKSLLNATDAVADKMVATFYALLDRADLPPISQKEAAGPQPADQPAAETEEKQASPLPDHMLGERAPADMARHEGEVHLHYNIQIHLPANRDIEVFHSIFKSLRENLLAQ